MNVLSRLADILLRRLDTLINPRIENRVIYGSFISGVGLIAVPRLIRFLGLFEFRSRSVDIVLRLNDDLDQVSTILGFILVLMACGLLYLLKYHTRPELVLKSASPTAHKWPDFPYSFTRPELIHPRIIQDLNGWISDTGQQIVSIHLAGSNNSNRYHGEITTREYKSRTLVEWHEGRKSFSYEYLGTSESGVHVLHTVDCGGGSGRFHDLMFVVLEQDEGIRYDEGERPILIERCLIRMIGRVGLGDRYGGKVQFDRGVMRISSDKSPFGESVVQKGFSIVVR